MATVARSVEITGLNEVRSFLEAMNKDYGKALKISVNKGIDRARTQSWKDVKAQYTIRQGAFYKRFKQVKATSEAHPSGKVIISASPAVPLHEFKTSITQKGVNVTIRKASGPKLIAGAFHMHRSKTMPVFLRTHMPTGLVWRTRDPRKASRIPWKRLVESGRLPKEARLPIRKLHSLTAAQVVDDGQILEGVISGASDDMIRELERQIDRMIRRI